MPQLYQEVNVLQSKAEGVPVALEVQRVLTEMSGTTAEPSMPLPMVGFILEGHTHSIGSLAAHRNEHQTDAPLWPAQCNACSEGEQQVANIAMALEKDIGIPE